MSWFAEVGVILLPGQEVTDWGVVRQDGNRFHVNITVEWVTFPPPPVPLPGPLPGDPSLHFAPAFSTAQNGFSHLVGAQGAGSGIPRHVDPEGCHSSSSRRAVSTSVPTSSPPTGSPPTSGSTSS